MTVVTLPHRSCAAVIACLAFAWQPSSALAGDEDVQFWLNANAQTNLNDDLRLTLDGSLRFREAARGNDQETIRITAEQTVGKGISIGGGFGVFETGGATELRTHQQLGVAMGRFAALTRLEERFFDNGPRMELRLRQRLRYTQPISAEWSASIEGEYLHLLQTRREDPRIRTSEWRGRVAVDYRASGSVSLGAGYLVIHTPGGNVTPDRTSHVPQAVIGYRF